jgi:hypothetical protein
LVLAPVVLRHDVAGPGDVGEDVDHLSGVGADPVPLRDRLEASLYEVRLRAVPHDGVDGRAEPVAGRHRRNLRVRRSWPDERHAGAPPRLCRLRPERHSAFADADARPASIPALRRLLEVLGVDGEEDDVVSEDHPLPAVGGAVNLAHHAGAEIADAESTTFVSQDDPVVVVVEAVLDDGRGDKAGPYASLFEPACALVQFRVVGNGLGATD